MTTPNARTLESYERAAALYRSLAAPEPWPALASFLGELVERIPGGSVLAT